MTAMDYTKLSCVFVICFKDKKFSLKTENKLEEEANVRCLIEIRLIYVIKPSFIEISLHQTEMSFFKSVIDLGNSV
jgi:hypothetical protein